MHSARRVFGTSVTISIPPEMADEATLLGYLGVTPAELKKIWWYRNRMYHEFTISKSSGKARVISAPDRRLKIIQHKIVPLLNALYRVRNPVHGFVSRRSVKTNAEAHGGRRFVVNIDLEDFFGSITEKRVVGLLTAIGTEARVSEIIARLCCREGQLPQGAPTSPVVSNMICYRMDTDLLQIAKQSRCIYTRYADDLTFSSHQPPSLLFESAVPAAGRFAPNLLAISLKNAIATNGFTINAEKAHYADRNSRRMVTGVKINAGLNVDRRYIRHIRAVLHSVETTGLSGAQAKYSASGGTGNVADHVRGKISYVGHLKGQADPVVRSLVGRYNKSFKGRKIKLLPTDEEQRYRSVWVVDHPDSTGTCFFLKGVGLVTCAHCVKGLDEVDVLHPTKHTTLFSTAILHRDEDRDLAILDTSPIPPSEFYELELASTDVVATDKVVALGYPGWGLGERLNIRPGEVTVITRKHGVPMIEVSQQLTQGMSGGPVVDQYGRVVGVIRSGGPSEGRQFSVNAKELTATAKMLPDEKSRDSIVSTEKLVPEGESTSEFRKWVRREVRRFFSRLRRLRLNSSNHDAE